MKQVVGEERVLPISQRVISSPNSPQRLRVFAVGVGRSTTLCHGKDMWCDRHPFPSSHALLLVALRRNRLRGSPNGEEEKREADWKQEDPEAWITPVYKQAAQKETAGNQEQRQDQIARRPVSAASRPVWRERKR
jgi:hypothetical protein